MAVVTDRVAEAVGPAIHKLLRGDYMPEELSALAALACLVGTDEQFTVQELAPTLEVLGVQLTRQMIGKLEQFRVFGVAYKTGERKVWVRQYEFWHEVRRHFKMGALRDFQAVNQQLLKQANKEAVGGRDFGVMTRQVIYTMRLGNHASAAIIADELMRYRDASMRQQFLVRLMSDMP